jgi:Ca-activated chloride channel family protein
VNWALTANLGFTWGQPRLLWLAVAAPLAVAAAWWIYRRRLGALRSWAEVGLWDRLLPELSNGRGTRRAALAAVALGLLVLSASFTLARPRWGERRQAVERKGIDIVFVLDSSLSMAAQDVQPSRLTLAASLIRSMARELPGNRLGLVQSEGESLVLAPLTTDAGVIDLVLDTVEPGSLPVAGSRLARGVQSALELFPPGEDKHRAIVLLSDGEDHGGAIPETLAALEERHVVLHAIGLGTRAGGPLPVPGGATNEWKRDRQGQVVVSRLDPTALTKLSQGTSGRYLEVDRSITDASPIVDALRSMEGRTIDELEVATHEERFQWPLGGALVALLISLVAGPFRT